MAVPLLLAAAVLVTALPHCKSTVSPLGTGKGGASAASKPGAEAAPQAWVAKILAAEHARKTDAVPADAESHTSPEVREAAARALARIADHEAGKRLLPLLSDEVPAITEYAAFGLGRAPSGREPEFTRAIALRAMNLQIRDGGTPRTRETLASFASALGRLGTDEAERSLAAWLGFPAPVAEAAALSLGQLGARRGRLDDATLVALLEAAAAQENSTQAALYAFSRVAPPEGLLVERALALARRSGAVRDRKYRVQALSRLGNLEDLSQALARPDLSSTEAAELTRALAQKGKEADALVSDALLARVPEGTEQLAALVDQPSLDVLLVLLENLDAPGRAKAALVRLTQLAVPTASRARARRSVLLRCSAARILAERNSHFPDLSTCDPDPKGRIGKLTQLRVLSRGSLSGARGEAYRALASDADPGVRQAALRLMPSHREIEASATLLTDALNAAAPGTRAVAAEVLSQHPDRASPFRAKDSGAKQPDPRVLEALTSAIRGPKASDAVGVRTALIDAAAALGVLGVLSDIEKDCRSDVLTLRVHAARALSQLGRPGQRCSAKESAFVPEELGHLIRGRTRLIFETDLGELTLEIDPARAPVAATRVIDLARSGFYDGTRVHRVVPGFVVQFGDREGDGYGGAPRPPLRSEWSPGSFEAFAVGIAESGADTGSSQLFVTLGRFPHLDGESTHIGRAGKGWERLLEGDQIAKVRVEKP
jgi:cyclophilin family peptidyl-prolyl cis-trans isomerase